MDLRACLLALATAGTFGLPATPRAATATTPARPDGRAVATVRPVRSPARRAAARRSGAGRARRTTRVRADTIRTGRIEFAGLRRLDASILRREMRLAPGEPFDHRRLERSRERLVRVPGVDFVRIRVAYQPEDSAMGLRVVVGEAPTLGAGVARGAEDRWSVNLWMRDVGWRGRAERLSVRLRLLNDAALRVAWENPWIGSGPRLGAGIEAWAQRYDYAWDDFGGAVAGTRISRAGAIVRGIRESPWPVPRPWERAGEGIVRHRVDAGVGVERVDSDAIGLHAPGRTQETTALAELRARLDTRTARAFPFGGARVALVVRARHGDGVASTSARVDARAFTPLGPRAVLAAHARAVLRAGTRRAWRREHLGGGFTLRGLDYGSLHGWNALLAGVEVRVPVNFTRREPLPWVLLGLEVHAFADLAGAWDRASDLDATRLRPGFGVGVALLNRQTRGLRVDWAVSPGHSPRVHLETGLAF